MKYVAGGGGNHAVILTQDELDIISSLSGKFSGADTRMESVWRETKELRLNSIKFYSGNERLGILKIRE